jgi:SAM-dependent methyltransferase
VGNARTHTGCDDEGSAGGAFSWPARRLLAIETFSLHRGAGKPGRVLDAGCGGGLMLDSFLKLGWRTAGIEPGRAPSREARLRDHDVCTGLFSDTPVEGRFDLVVFSHALEHMRDPEDALQRARGLLAPSKRIAVVTPNAGGLLARAGRDSWWQLDAPRHYGVPTSAGLHAVARKVGLRVERLETHSVPLGISATAHLARDPAATIAIPPPGARSRASAIAARLVGELIDAFGLGDSLHAVMRPVTR